MPSRTLSLASMLVFAAAWAPSLVAADGLLQDPEFDGPGVWKEAVWLLEDKVTKAGTVTFGAEADDKLIRLERTVESGNMFTIQTSQRVAFTPGSTYTLKITGRSPQSAWVAIWAQKDDGYYEAMSDVQYKHLPVAFGMIEADVKAYDYASGPMRLSICLASGPVGTAVELTKIEMVSK